MRTGALPDPLELVADCSRCFALCCVALPFAASSDFAFDKPGGRPCPNLQPDFGCGIHARLRTSGFPGCTAYDCFGAGQKTSQVVCGGEDWREDPSTAARMFAAFPVVQQLHELLWYLGEARELKQTRGFTADLDEAYARVQELSSSDPDVLAACDVPAERADVDVLLRRASELVRAGAPGKRRSLRGADLVGADLRQQDLRGLDLRGGLLLGADLRGSDLSATDLIGADLRGADLRGARLAGSLFLTAGQVGAAVGDVATTLPGRLRRPAHWG